MKKLLDLSFKYFTIKGNEVISLCDQMLKDWKALEF
jgi:hypothetical protein